MKPVVATLALTICILLFACGKEAAVYPANPTSAPVSECPGEYINQTIELNTGLRWDQYTVERATCNAGRGGNLIATILHNGQEVRIVSKSGFCQPDGKDCGWSLCIGGKDVSVIESAKRITCPKLKFFTSETMMCPGPKSDLTSTAQQNCANGFYTTHAGDQLIFSVKQTSDNKCQATVQPDTEC